MLSSLGNLPSYPLFFHFLLLFCLIAFIFHSSVLVVTRALFLARGNLFNLYFKCLLESSSLVLSLIRLDKIMDGLLLSGMVDESKSPDSGLDAPCGSTSVQVSVFWSGSSCVWAKHSGRSAGWWGNCARGFSVTHSQACFKNYSHYSLPGLFPQFLFEDKSPFHL